MMYSDDSRGAVVPALVLALGIVIAAWIGAHTFYAVHALDNTLSVTGSATQDATADSGKLTVSVARNAYEATIPSVQSRIAADTQTIINFFGDAGIVPTDILVTPISIDQEYSSDSNAPRRYNVRQQITVRSSDVSLIDTLSKSMVSLSNKGILVSVNPPEYYLSTLPKIRVALMGAAVQDARARATEIASSTGQRVGALQSASSGVVQVMAPSSVDVADYGMYDTSTIDKQVMVTARAVFLLK